MSSTRTTKKEALADFLKRTRRGALLSQEQLANELDVSRRSVAAYESGETEPPATVVLDWLAVCGRPLDDLNALRGGDEGVSRTAWLSRGPYGPYHQPELFDPDVTEEVIDLRNEEVTAHCINSSSALAAA